MSSYSEGQVHQLVEALERAEWTPNDLRLLGQFGEEGLAKIRAVIRGWAEVVIKKHLIDLDADPFCPDGWKVAEHRKGGQFEWSPTKVKLYLSPNQQNGQTINGDKLRQELTKEAVMNANVLDYLLANQCLIPEEWKGQATFFWGTIYRGADGSLCVRCLSWSGGQWRWRYNWLAYHWGGGSPSLLLAS